MEAKQLLIALCLCGITSAVSAQAKLVDRRDQASGWYLPVEGKVTASRAKTQEFSVLVYKDNRLLGEVKPKKGKFLLELDLNQVYSVRLCKEGYQEKLITIDTSMPEQQVQYPAYPCVVNLEPADKFVHSDPFYLDFPSAIVRWNDEMKGFYHSSEYLTDIQVKMALLAAQVTPN
ncbi:MAG TPA: hypothetical protein VHL57_04365 [Flavobacteriales bacterium]|jgi:hypothetical protein|nr:hypothetical protein [Flavobacteriales bacterium]